MELSMHVHDLKAACFCSVVRCGYDTRMSLLIILMRLALQETDNCDLTVTHVLGRTFSARLFSYLLSFSFLSLSPFCLSPSLLPLSSSSPSFQRFCGQAMHVWDQIIEGNEIHCRHQEVG